MALATRPRPTAHTRKRQAKHHRQNKHYIKAYLPYLPMLAIVLGGVVLNKIWTPSGVAAQSVNVGSVPDRIGAIAGSSNITAFYIVLGVSIAAFLIFVIRHGYRFHRLINKGEAFIIHHPWLDISLVALTTIGVVLTRS